MKGRGTFTAADDEIKLLEEKVIAAPTDESGT
jgi:hypothetical protein